MIIASKSIIANATNSVFPIANATCLQIILFHSTNAKLLLFNFVRSKMSCIRFYGLESVCIMLYESEAIRTPFHSKNSRFSSRIESHIGSVSPASSLTSSNSPPLLESNLSSVFEIARSMLCIFSYRNSSWQVTYPKVSYDITTHVRTNRISGKWAYNLKTHVYFL